MHNVTTSRHIRGSSELMIMVPVKNEFVPITELVMTYAARISIVLQALAELRQQKVERGFDNPIGPIERLQTIYRVQWTVIEPFDDVTTSKSTVTRQTHGPQVVLTSHFDSSWEDYFQDLVTTGGPLLDLIFSHCQDYEGFSCKDGYEAFARFIRRHQRRCDFLYATLPEVTVDDIRYRTKYNSKGIVPTVELEAREIVTDEVGRLGEHPKHDARTRSALRTIQALYDIRERLFLKTGGIRQGAEPRSDQKLFDDAVTSTLEREPELYRLSAVLNELGRTTPPELLKAASWISQIVEKTRLKLPLPKHVQTPLEEAHASLPSTSLTDDEITALLSDVQGNILNGFPTDAAAEDAKLLLIRCDDRAALRRLLVWAKTHLTTETANRDRATTLRINVGITDSGLKLLQLPDTIMEWLPREFREGMEERAGLLGDVAHNHPKHWQWPVRHHGQDAERVHLSTVHVALVMVGKRDSITASQKDFEGQGLGYEVVHLLDLDPNGTPERSQPVSPTALRHKPRVTSAQALEQPADEHAVVPDPSPLDVQALGELILGYPNKAGDTAACTRAQLNDTGSVSLFRNGSFMAMRKMEQRPVSSPGADANAPQDALSEYVRKAVEHIFAVTGAIKEQQAELREELTADVTALIIGRRPDGKMLGPIHEDGKDPNEFDYSRDERGTFCPLDSHIRRANPRQKNTPRIARRGLPYGPPVGGPEKGLLFMAYCANLSAQYEIIQRWVNGGNSTGLLSQRNDLVFGAPMDTKPRVVSLAGTCAKGKLTLPPYDCITLPAFPQDEKTGEHLPFVTLRWGIYLFVPSRTAVQWMIDFQPDTRLRLAVPAVERGNARIAELEALPASVRTYEWKRLLEEVPEAESPQALHARDVADAITDRGGALLVHGQQVVEERVQNLDVVVVTTLELAQEVLGNSVDFSVREYRARLAEALTDHYLGYDLDSIDVSGLSYEALSKEPNEAFKNLVTDAEGAFAETATLLKEPGTLELDPDGKDLDATPRSTISVRDLASAVIGTLCHKWLDMPGKNRDNRVRGLMEAVERILVASRYCFQALPVPYLAEQAHRNQAGILADYPSVEELQSTVGKEAGERFRNIKLKPVYGPAQGPGSPLPSSEVQRLSTTVLLGAVGFAPPAVGAITRILDYWIETEKLWQIQQTYNSSLNSRPRDLRPAILDALSKAPAPPTLYRTATKARPLGNLPEIPANARVIVNLAAVYADAVRKKSPVPEAWFFGGLPGGATGMAPQHGCPGQTAGLVVIEQVIAALLKRKNIRRERRMLISYDRG